MKTIGLQTYEFEIIETRKYIVQGDGHGHFEAEQDAIERFHRLTKSGDMTPHTVSKPRLVDKGKHIK